MGNMANVGDAFPGITNTNLESSLLLDDVDFIFGGTTVSVWSRARGKR